MNAKPLKLSAYKKALSFRGKTIEDIILRIDIPKGYRVPITQRALTCTFWDASCDFTVAGQQSGQIGMVASWSDDTLTFDTAGSYIELGIGNYIKAHYDHNTFSSDIFQVTGAQSAYAKVHASVKVSGNLLGIGDLANKSSWSKDIDILEGLNIEILHPYSSYVRTGIIIEPILTLGASIAMNGSLTYVTTMERKGEIRYAFDSQTSKAELTSDVKDSGNLFDPENITVDVEASGNVYLFPNLTYIPNIELLRINKPLSIIALRSGIQLDTTLSGKIEEGFNLVDDAKESAINTTTASVTTSIFGQIQGKWMIEVGNWKVYESENYTNIGSKIAKQDILEWKAQLIKAPTIHVNDSDDENKKLITFSSSDVSAIASKLHYYYQVGTSPLATPDIPTKHFSPPEWRSGDAPIEVDKGSTIKVRAVLYNKDVSTSYWAFGASVSQQVQLQLADVQAPRIFPVVYGFENSLEVMLLQNQGYDVYYSINGGPTQKYQGTMVIYQTSTISAYTKAEINGEIVLSEKVSFTYTKCDTSQNLVDGYCIDASSSSSFSSASASSQSSSSQASNSDLWAQFPYPEYCPLNVENKTPSCILDGSCVCTPDPSSEESTCGGYNDFEITIADGTVKCYYTDDTAELIHEDIYDSSGTYNGFTKAFAGGGSDNSYYYLTNYWKYSHGELLSMGNYGWIFTK